MKEELNKKNKEITGLIVLISILLIIGAFFIGQYLGNKKSSEPETKNNTSINENEPPKQEDNNKETDNKQVEKDVYEKISDVKKNSELSDTEKAEKIFQLIVEYTGIDYKDCKFKVDTGTADNNNYYTTSCNNGSSIGISKEFDKISIDQTGDYSLIKNQKNNIEILKNNEIKSKYLAQLEKEFKTDDISAYFKKQYNLNNGICFEYSIDGNYFNLVVVQSSKGWYDYDQYTGKCENKIKTLSTYKFDMKTDKYEIVD